MVNVIKNDSVLIRICFSLFLFSLPTSCSQKQYSDKIPEQVALNFLISDILLKKNEKINLSPLDGSLFKKGVFQDFAIYFDTKVEDISEPMDYNILDFSKFELSKLETDLIEKKAIEEFKNSYNRKDSLKSEILILKKPNLINLLNIEDYIDDNKKNKLILKVNHHISSKIGYFVRVNLIQRTEKELIVYSFSVLLNLNIEVKGWGSEASYYNYENNIQRRIIKKSSRSYLDSLLNT